MKYVSIDIETTGIDPKQHEVVEFAAIIDNLDGTNRPREELPSFRVLFIKDNWNVNPYCALLHRDLWDEMAKRKNEIPLCQSRVGVYRTDGKVHMTVAEYDAIIQSKHINCVMDHHGSLGFIFRHWIQHHLCGSKKHEDNPMPKVTAAGKNFANFDLRFLEKEPVALTQFVDIRHRVIDIATHFWQYGDECLPDTLKCMKRAGLNPDMKLSHTAEEDAWNVIQLVRRCMTGEVNPSGK